MTSHQVISVIIPAWKEGERLARLSEKFKYVPDVEVVAAMAEGDVDTVLPDDNDVIIVRSSTKGRARQMIEGVRASSGDILLFLHADTKIDPKSFHNIRNALNFSDVIGGSFSISIGEKGLHGIYSAIINLRSRLLKLPYGDQAIFVKREVYEAIGGFEDVPIMEDIRLISAMNKVGRLVILSDVAVTSDRKWKKDGFLYGTLRNWSMLLAHKLGVAPEKLVRWYYPD